MHDTLLCIRRRATSADKRAAQPLTPAPWQTERRTHPRENQAAVDQRELLGASATKVEWPHSHRVLGMVPASALVFWLSIDGLKHLQDDIAKAPKLMVGKLDDGSFDGSFKETVEVLLGASVGRRLLPESLEGRPAGSSLQLLAERVGELSCPGRVPERLHAALR